MPTPPNDPTAPGLAHALATTTDHAHRAPVAGMPVGASHARRSVIEEYLDDDLDAPPARASGKVARGEDTVNGGRTALANYFTRVANGAGKRV